MLIGLFTESDHRGGLDTFIATVLEWWPNAQDRFVLFCNHDHPGLSGLASVQADRVRLVPYERPQPSRRSVFSPLLRYARFMATAVRLRRRLSDFPLDRLFLVSGGYPAGTCCRAATLAWRFSRGSRPAAVFSVHSLAVAPRWWEAWPERLLDRLIAGGIGRLTTVSHAAAAALSRRPGLPEPWVIYNGIAPPAPPARSAAAIRSELNIAQDAPLCLMLATLHPYKGQMVLLQAVADIVAEIPDLALVFAGDGSDQQRAALQKAAADLGVDRNVRVLGFRDDAGDLTAAGDLIVLPSLEHEAFGLVLVEAMARGVAVVGSRVGGIPEVVGNPACIVAPGDKDALAQVLRRFLHDPALRAKLAEEGMDRYETKFTARRMAQEYAHLLCDES